ncbi:hypothetical protein SCUP234_09132 [Seiridium cupressi]
MQFKNSIVIALASALVAAAPSNGTSTAPLRDQIAALDQAGALKWEDMDSGRFATIPMSGDRRRRDNTWVDKISGINPSDWLGKQWHDLGLDVRVDDLAGRILCPGGGSSMQEYIIDQGAQLACQTFVSKSITGQLGLKAWHAWEQWSGNELTTSDGKEGYVRWLIGSVSDTPHTLTEEFCGDMCNAVKAVCIQTAGDTQGQAISVADWIIYADPNAAAGE